jgi:hypothetical protein
MELDKGRKQLTYIRHKITKKCCFCQYLKVVSLKIKTPGSLAGPGFQAGT